MMRRDGFALTPALSLTRERVQGPPSVILSGDHARTGNRRLPRRNLGRDETSVSQAVGDRLKPVPPKGSLEVTHG